MQPPETDDPANNRRLSEAYAAAAAVTLLLLVLVDDARVTAAAAILGLAAGAWVARRGEVRRAALVGAAGFAAALALAAWRLWRG